MQRGLGPSIIVATPFAKFLLYDEVQSRITNCLFTHLEIIMKSKSFPSLGLKRWLLLGTVSAISIILFLNWIDGVVYPSQIDDMGLAIVKRRQFKLDILIALSLFMPILLFIIDFVYVEKYIEAKKGVRYRSLSSLSASNEKAREFPAQVTFRILVLMEIVLIASISYYLIISGFDALDASIDFLLGNPGLLLVKAYAIVAINYVLIICILLYSFLLLDSSAEWIFIKMGFRFKNNKYSHAPILIISSAMRVLLAFVLLGTVHFNINYSGKLSEIPSDMTRVSLILGLTIAICFLPLMYEKIIANSNHLTSSQG